MKDPNNMWEISESQDVKAEQSPPRNRVSKTQNQNKRVSNLIKDELLKNEESILVDQKYLYYLVFSKKSVTRMKKLKKNHHTKDIRKKRNYYSTVKYFCL